MSDSGDEEIVKRRRLEKNKPKKKDLKNLFDDESSTESVDDYVQEDVRSNNMYIEIFGTGDEYFYIFEEDDKQEIREENKRNNINEEEFIEYVKNKIKQSSTNTMTDSTNTMTDSTNTMTSSASVMTSSANVMTDSWNTTTVNDDTAQYNGNDNELQYNGNDNELQYNDNELQYNVNDNELQYNDNELQYNVNDNDWNTNTMDEYTDINKVYSVYEDIDNITTKIDNTNNTIYNSAQVDGTSVLGGQVDNTKDSTQCDNTYGNTKDSTQCDNTYGSKNDNTYTQSRNMHTTQPDNIHTYGHTTQPDNIQCDNIEVICKHFLQGYNLFSVFYNHTQDMSIYDFIHYWRILEMYNKKKVEYKSVYDKDLFNIIFDRLYNGGVVLDRDDRIISITKKGSTMKGVVLDEYGNLIDKFSSLTENVLQLVEEVTPKYIFVSGDDSAVRTTMQLLMQYNVFYMESKYYTSMSVYDRLVHVGRLAIYPEIEFIHFYNHLDLQVSGLVGNGVGGSVYGGVGGSAYGGQNGNGYDGTYGITHHSHINEYGNGYDSTHGDAHTDTSYGHDNTQCSHDNTIDYNNIKYSESSNKEGYTDIIKMAIQAVISCIKIDIDFILQYEDKLALMKFLGLEKCTRIFENSVYEDEDEIRHKLDDVSFVNFMTYFRFDKVNRPVFTGFNDHFVFRELIGLQINSVTELIDKEVTGNVFYVDEYYVLVHILNGITCYVRCSHKYYLNQLVKVKILEVNEAFLSFTGEIITKPCTKYKAIKHPLLVNMSYKEAVQHLLGSSNLFILRQKYNDSKVQVLLKLYNDIVTDVMIDMHGNNGYSSGSNGNNVNNGYGSTSGSHGNSTTNGYGNSTANEQGDTTNGYDNEQGDTTQHSNTIYCNDIQQNIDEVVNKTVKSILKVVASIRKHRHFYDTEQQAYEYVSVEGQYVKYAFYFSITYPGRVVFIYNVNGIHKDYIRVKECLMYKDRQFSSLDEFVVYRKSM